MGEGIQNKVRFKTGQLLNQLKRCYEHFGYFFEGESSHLLHLINEFERQTAQVKVTV